MSLNQLTENYTDSEDENESKIKNLSVSSDEEASSMTKSSAKNSPNSIDSRGSENSPKRSLGGLVSYANEDEDDDDPSLYKYKLDESDENLDLEPMDTDDENEDTEKNNALHNDIRLPLPPQGKCSTHLQDKVSHFINRMKNHNTDWNWKIQNNKDFRNPSIYEKLIDHLGIDEMGSNYPLHMFDPHCWGKESFYDQLAKIQKEEMDKREKERKDKTKVDIISGTKKTSDDLKKRPSRFDQGSSGLPISSKSISHPPPLLKTVPSGQKKINAFGALPKLK